MANVGNHHELLFGNLVKATSSTSVLLCILLAISYTAIIRLPRAFDHHAEPCVCYQLFLIFNSISFFSSGGGILLLTGSTLSRLMSSSRKSPPLTAADQAYASTSPESDGRMRLVETSFPQFVYLIFCLLLSLASAGCAFLFVGLAFLKVLTWQQVPVILKVLTWPQVPVILMCVVGGLLYIDIFLVKVVDLLRVSRECIRSQPQLWQATKRETVCGRLCTSYLEYVLNIGPMAPSASSLV